MKRSVRTAVASALTALCFCSGAGAKVVKFPNPPGADMRPLAMNDKGQVAGWSLDPHSGVIHGFFWQPGSDPVTFDAPGAAFTYPTGISSSGVISGWYYNQSGTINAGFIRAADGTITTVKMGLFGANAKGWIVGGYSPGPGRPPRPFLRDPSGATRFFRVPRETEGAGATVVNRSRTIAGVAIVGQSAYQAFIRPAQGSAMLFGDVHGNLQVTGINDAGTVAGYYSGEGFVRTSDGTLTTFAAPKGASQIDVMGIDSVGTVAGWFQDSSKVLHGFLRAADGTFTRFNVKGANSTEIYAISVKGAIAGIYGSTSGSGMFAGKP